MRPQIDFASLTRDIRYALSDPATLVQKLGLAEGAKLKPTRAVIRCPAHEDRNPSCSVTQGKDRTVRAKCFSCGFTADAIGLVAKVRGLDTRGPDFILVLAEAAKLAGLHDTSQALLAGRELPKRDIKKPTPKPDKPFPPANEVKRVWHQSPKAEDDTECSAYLVSRRIDPGNAPAKAIPKTATLPRWASYWGDADQPTPWLNSGHRLIIPTFDANGIWRSLRAIRVTENDTPKRLPPCGFRAQGLVMANRQGVLMLRKQSAPDRVVIVEGEPDWLVWASRTPPNTECPYAVLGVVSGSWSPELATKFPNGCNVILRTHGDKTGDRYAADFADALKDRCRVWRAA